MEHGLRLRAWGRFWLIGFSVCLWLWGCKGAAPTSPGPRPSKRQEIWCTLNFKIKVTNFLVLMEGGPQNFGSIEIRIHSVNIINEFTYDLPKYGESWEKELSVAGFKTGAGYWFQCLVPIGGPNWQKGNVRLVLKITSQAGIIITPSEFDESFLLGVGDRKQFDFFVKKQVGEN